MFGKLFFGSDVLAVNNNQIRKILKTGLRVSVLNVNRTCDDITSDSIDDEVLCDVVELEKKEKLLAGYYNTLFAHPESLLSSRFGRSSCK